MKENQAYVIQIFVNNRNYYLGKNDGTTSKIRSAILYTDEIFAKSEIDRINVTYKESQNFFLNNPNNITLKLVEINVI